MSNAQTLVGVILLPLFAGFFIFIGHSIEAGASRVRAEAATRSRPIVTTIVPTPCAPGDACVAPSITVHTIEHQSRNELLAFLRTLPPDTLAMVGYVGDDGNAHALTEADLSVKAKRITYVEPEPGVHIVEVP